MAVPVGCDVTAEVEQHPLRRPHLGEAQRVVEAEPAAELSGGARAIAAGTMSARYATPAGVISRRGGVSRAHKAMERVQGSSRTASRNSRLRLNPRSRISGAPGRVVAAERCGPGASRAASRRIGRSARRAAGARSHRAR